MPTPPRPRRQNIRLAIPTRIFFWTLDQVASMLSLDEDLFRSNYVYYVDRSSGPVGSKLQAVNIRGDSVTPDWRIENAELIKWLRRRGFVFYDEGRYDFHSPS